MWQGSVVSLHIAPRAAAPMESLQAVRAVPGRGLEGDRYFLGTGLYSPKASHGGREVTLVEAEAVAALFDGVQNAEGHRLGIKLSAAESLIPSRWPSAFWTPSKSAATASASTSVTSRPPWLAFGE